MSDVDTRRGPTSTQQEWVFRVLGVGPAAPSGPGTDTVVSSGPSIVALQKSRLAWDSTRKAIQNQLKQLETAIISGVKAHNTDPNAEDEYDEDEVATGVTRLYTILDKLDTRLIDTLDEALNAEAAARPPINKRAVTLIGEYQTFVATDKMVADIDGNGFIDTAIRATVETTLKALSTQLRA